MGSVYVAEKYFSLKVGIWTLGLSMKKGSVDVGYAGGEYGRLDLLSGSVGQVV